MAICKNQSYRNCPESVDADGFVRVSCKRTRSLCHCQYWCRKERRYKLIGNAKTYCKNFIEA